MPQQPRVYCLVIKRKNNDFLPVDWHLTKFYKGENLYTLDGIDAFTAKTTRQNLIRETLDKNLVSPDEQFECFSIIYKTKKGARELKEGVIFSEDTAVLSEDELIEFLLTIQNDKQLLNEVFNICHFKDDDEQVKEFKFVLKQLDLFKARGQNGVKAALSLFKKISYDKKRTIILRVVDTIFPRITKRIEAKKEETSKLELKNVA
jgi:hypothetical protein